MAPDQSRAKKAPRSWDALTPSLAQWILDYLSSMGFEQPTPVQKSCLEIFRGNKDVVVEAVTGSGKTLAFLIPVVERILRGAEPSKRHHVQGIIISPTRELATQIYNVLLSLIKFHAPSSEMLSFAEADEKRPETAHPVVVPQLLVGGTTKAAEDLSTFLRLSPNLLIATPGRLAELLSSPYVKAPASSFEVLVMDEADRLLDLGFSQELTRILGYLPKQRRTGLFSASLSEAVEKLILVGMLYPHKITVRVRSLKDGGIIQERKTPMSLQMSYIVAPASKKLPALCQLLEKLEPRPARSIIFFSTCYAVKYFTRVLQAILPPGFSIASLHGKLEPQVREKNFERFVNATSPTILLTTDIAARGLDIPQVDLVVQHDPPTDTKVFIHRCGRAGRAGRRGLAVVMLQEGREEEYVQLLEVRMTPIAPLDKPLIDVSDEEADQVSAKLRAQARADREIFQLAQRAFVSWARSYLEHQASSIFRITDLDWRDLAKGWGLLELPKMPELRSLDVDRSLGLGIETEAVAFRDKVREKKRQEELVEWKAAKSNDAWSAKHDQEDVKVARREKKRRKREAERFSQMTDKEKEEQKKLDALIGEVRKQTKAKEAAAKEEEEEFEGFGE
ncbi:P-loop containing nucleoside triphosphate hydrolase protein [Lasiosphaeria miniovina]|uniref:ATP-dependent RNA helicase n=1 Tax=Lasiosphaeria miniovina TaxID=1954250 RepID=A0AA40A080_9PEZI|nr:P-loop containing nucleoside triphosphate hydrolase protein [Lasiosphaeria miniovina]KAK0706922.1 P-loop containing nucleoside triphosphate hydrolase protein [Lasiosphaeria miniovina]